jgi:hypothetical protein
VWAYVDESYEVGPSGLYVLAAVLAEPEDPLVREAMLALREPWRGQAKLHFYDAEPKRPGLYLDTVASLGREIVVVLARPCRKPERSRRKALERLMWELRARIDGMVIESRGARQNRDDKVVLAALQRGHRQFVCDFPLGRDEPVLWAADIVASGVFRAYLRGEHWMLDRLGAITLHVVEVDTNP